MMVFELNIFADEKLRAGFLEWLLEEQWPGQQEHFGRLWDYYQNPTVAAYSGEEDGRAVQAQETGLPVRITGRRYRSTREAAFGKPAGDIQRKEVVIENDIAWRIGAMVDFLFGKGVSFVSRAAEASRAKEIEQILKVVFEANGGAGFFQDLAVLGSVYGFADCLLRAGERLSARLHRGQRCGVSSTSLGTSDFHAVLEHAHDLGSVMGAIAIVETGEAEGQLRWFYLEPSCRGMGIGRNLMETAMSYCKERNLEKVFLWTVRDLEQARRLYVRFGFSLVETHERFLWGRQIVEEKWEQRFR